MRGRVEHAGQAGWSAALISECDAAVMACSRCGRAAPVGAWLDVPSARCWRHGGESVRPLHGKDGVPSACFAFGVQRGDCYAIRCLGVVYSPSLCEHNNTVLARPNTPVPSWRYCIVGITTTRVVRMRPAVVSVVAGSMYRRAYINVFNVRTYVSQHEADWRRRWSVTSGARR